MRLAAEVVGAADVAAAGGRAPHKVALYLYGHGLELMVKAILVCAGSNEKRLRRLGHDLSAAFKAARRHPGSLRLNLAPRDHALIGMLSPYFIPTNRDPLGRQQITLARRGALLPVRAFCDRTRRTPDHAGPPQKHA